MEKILNEQYRKFSFFEPCNEERYIKYAKDNSHMDAEEIVWRVNNNLDKEKYQYDVCVFDCSDICVIVNKYFKLPMDYVPQDLVDEDGQLMRKCVAESYILMREAAKAEGLSILHTSSQI